MVGAKPRRATTAADLAAQLHAAARDAGRVRQVLDEPLNLLQLPFEMGARPFEPHLHAPGARMCLEAIWGINIETLSCSGYDHNWVLDREDGTKWHLDIGGAYVHSLVRTPEGWRIASTGYRRTYELSSKLSGLPDAKVTKGTAYEHPPQG